MKTNYEIMKELSEILNNKISYAERHDKRELDLLYNLVDEIADIFNENEKDFYNWYWLCNAIPPDQYDKNAIS